MLDDLTGLHTEELRGIFSEAPIGLCCFDSNLRYILINDWLAGLNGLSVEAHLGRSLQELLPDVAEGVEAQLRQVLETGEPIHGGEVSAETPAQPGVRRYFQHHFFLVNSDSGSSRSVACVVEEVTVRKRAELALQETRDELEERVKIRTKELSEANLHLKKEIVERKQIEDDLRSLSARLISAQEEERSRIAREIHDDFSQRLALLAVSLERLHDAAPGAGKKDVASMIELTQGLASDLHRLSHGLHPSILQLLGLVPAVESLCSEISEKYGIAIDVVHDGVPGTLASEVALCVYRVVQEALRNVVKHAGAETVLVEINGTKDELSLRVSDDGKGFDPSAGRQGLGLLSMRERLRLVNGTISLTRNEPSGVRITVSIPFLDQIGPN